MNDNPPENRLSPLEQIKDRIKIPEIKARPSKWFYILSGLIIVAIVFFNLFFVYIKPYEFGIKVARVGIHRGVQKEIFHAGLNFVMPFGLQQMYRLPKGIQVLELTASPDTASIDARKDKVAHIQTSDGFYVDIDVSILYRIKDPYLVFTTIGPGNLYEDNGIIPKAEPALKEALGKLTTEEFYNSPLRVQKTEEAKQKLNEELNPKGLEIEHVLVRYFRYSPEIQKNIEEKKLKDQMVFTNQSMAKAAKEEAVLKKIVQEGVVIAAIELEKGKAYVTKKNAERDLYVRTKTAEADLLVKLAEAEKVRLRNEALKGEGSEHMVGLKMAEVYKGLDVVILPSDGQNGINPLKLDSAMKMFDVNKGGEK